MSAQAEGARPPSGDAAQGDGSLAAGVDREIYTGNQRIFVGPAHLAIAAACVLYTGFHIGVMNLYPLETWTYRLIHVTGGLILGFLLFSAVGLADEGETAARPARLQWVLLGPAAVLVALALGQLAVMVLTNDRVAMRPPPAPDKHLMTFGWPLAAGTALALVASWLFPDRTRARLAPADAVLALAALAVGGYVIAHAEFLRMRAQVFPHANDMWASVAGILLILEMTRRLAGLALVVIVALFVGYAFAGPWLPGFLEHRGYPAGVFFAFVYTDNGILGPTTAVSSTYIILFVTFAAFLQASRVGEYFVNFAFAAAGGARGGPAKVAVFGSALMGTINGTSAGNVVSTGSLTIPLMKKVGYRPQTAASVEAAASSGGQILPPIMGAGAFIMAEITGIAYSEIVIAAIIPALLYFLSVYFMVDKEALKKGMRGLPRHELPVFSDLARRAFLFIPIVMLIAALYMGYSVIRAGTYAMMAAAVVSWLTPVRMGPRAILYALEIAAKMSLQLVAVCAAAGIIVGVIALTGVGTRFSAMLLALVPAAGIVPHLTATLPAPEVFTGLLALPELLPAGADEALLAQSRQVAETAERLLATSERMLLIGDRPAEFRRLIEMSGQNLAALESLRGGLAALEAGLEPALFSAQAGAVEGHLARMERGLAALDGMVRLRLTVALVFAMLVSIILGMGMPTTAAYAVAASVIGPGLIRMGIEPLTAHFFIFYFAVMSAITPPVALAAYAGAAIARSDPMRTSVESFKIGLAAFVVPFMFFYSSALLMQGTWLEIAHVLATACLGIYLLASAVQGWLLGPVSWWLRIVLVAGAFTLIAGGWLTDAIGLSVLALALVVQKALVRPGDLVRGAD